MSELKKTSDESQIQTTRRGPRGKRGEKRQRILQAAHDVFTEMDYAQATYREIARRAEVDPALIAYYFNNKAQLLRESLSLPDDPKRMIVAAIWAGPPQQMGHRIVATILNTWEQAATAGTLSTLFYLLMRDASTQQAFAKYVHNEIIATVKNELNTQMVLPLELMMSSVLGMLLSRYVVRVEPLASMEREELIEMLGKATQRILEELDLTVRTDNSPG